MKTYLCLVLLTIFVCSCTDNKVKIFCTNCTLRNVDISKLHPAQLDSNLYEPLEIITVYPAKEVNSQNSNIYKCSFGRKGDTIYVFEANKKVDRDILNEIAKNSNGAIMNDELMKNPPKSTFIFVPEDFKLPDTAKFIFASPTAIEE